MLLAWASSAASWCRSVLTLTNDSRQLLMEPTALALKDPELPEAGRLHVTAGSFAGPVQISGSRESVSLLNCEFHDTVDFSELASESVDLSGSVFHGPLVLAGVSVRGDLKARSCRFEAEVTARGAVVTQTIDLSDSEILAVARTAWAEVRGYEATGPMVAKTVVLDRVLVEQNLAWAFSAEAVSMIRARFAAPGTLSFRNCTVDLTDAQFGGGFAIRRCPLFEGEASTTKNDPPAIASMMGARIEGLTLHSADMTKCRFTGALGLDKLRLTNCSWPSSPGWRPRRTVPDEHALRASEGAKRWISNERAHPLGYSAVRPSFSEVADTYRSLRKALEDAKDSPAAADFYFGEMEMRRKAAEQGLRQNWPDYLTLWLYRLSAGYGVRTWRALASFALLVCFGTISLACSGLELASKPLSNLETSVFALRASVSFARSLDGVSGLDVGQQITVLLLRLLGPLALGLAFLSVRNRVRR